MDRTGGYVRLALAVPAVRVADCAYNTQRMIQTVRRAASCGVDILLFPRLSLTGCSCASLFAQDTLLSAVCTHVSALCAGTADCQLLALVSVPCFLRTQVRVCTALVARGRVLALVVQDTLAACGAQKMQVPCEVLYGGAPVPVYDVQTCFESAEGLFSFCVGAMDGSVPATLVLQAYGTPSTAQTPDIFAAHAAAYSAQHQCAYAYVNAGWGESSADAVYGAESGIFECGQCVVQDSLQEMRERGERPAHAVRGLHVSADVDVSLVHFRRRARSGHTTLGASAPCVTLPAGIFAASKAHATLRRPRVPCPFFPPAFQKSQDAVPPLTGAACLAVSAPSDTQDGFLQRTIDLAAQGVALRLEHMGCRRLVVGVSGGVDSACALLICARALDFLSIARTQLYALTLPGFGTTSGTKGAAQEFARALGCTVQEISISAAVTHHLHDIGHTMQQCDGTYENAQARERTQILLDRANQLDALMIGTGDASEGALGWETFGGDHLSLYAVNASLPKTVVRALISYAGRVPERFVCETDSPYAPRGAAFSRVCAAIVAQPVSPELIPPCDDRIVQCTEEMLGPYELHDFFLYHVTVSGFGPRKLFRVAAHAFGTAYSCAQLCAALRVFFTRLFSQQFKRSCVPDGPGLTEVNLSPRVGFYFPSDTSGALWRAELEQLACGE